jgi:hypothetical protein
MLRWLLHAPRGPFYSPKAARSRWRQTWKAILSLCRVAHRTTTVACPVLDFLPNRAQSTVAASGPLAHRTLFGAHRTVRCPLPTVGATTCRAKIARPTVGAGNRWLTGQSGAPSDSPMIFSRTPRAALSPETSLAHRTLSGAPPDSPVCQSELNFGCSQPSLLQSDSSLFGTVSST